MLAILQRAPAPRLRERRQCSQRFPFDQSPRSKPHFRFVRDHHRRIKKVAIVTDADLGNLAEALASHFVSAEIRHFPAGQGEAARQWIGQDGSGQQAQEERSPR